jgi:hypothetical protein
MTQSEGRKLDLRVPTLSIDPVLLAAIRDEVGRLPTAADLHLGDAKVLSMIPDNSLHLIVTSTPFWNLKEYNELDYQMGHIEPTSPTFLKYPHPPQP